MKNIYRIFLAVLIIVFTTMAWSQTGGGAVPVFNEPLQYDFGEIPEGDSAVKIFEFVNTGNKSLVINKTNITCSCTQSKYPKEVLPGDTGRIQVVFDTEKKKGFYAQGVNLYYEGGEINIIIYATVLAKKEED